MSDHQAKMQNLSRLNNARVEWMIRFAMKKKPLTGDLVFMQGRWVVRTGSNDDGVQGKIYAVVDCEPGMLNGGTGIDFKEL